MLPARAGTDPLQIFIVERRVAHALACDADWQPAQVDGYDVDGAGCLVFGGQSVDGVVASVADYAAVDAYFDLFSGDWTELLVNGSPTQIFVSTSTPSVFGERNRRIETLVAQDVARLTAFPTGANGPINRAGLLMRARSYVRAADSSAPIKLRKGYSIADVDVEVCDLPYAKYFDVADVTLRHKRFDGSTSDPMVRSVLRSADAVTVLPYDPVLDQVVLVEQFRPGAFVRGDTHPWVLEPVAGRCDGDEPVERVAEREMVEEAGLTVLSLESIGNYYPSPGCLSEYLYSFVGVVDLSNAQTGLHGLDTENEDIRTHFLSFDAAMALIDSGEADNGPLMLSLYWLAANRARLRENASRA